MQLKDCDGVHFLDFLKVFDSGLSMGFSVSYFVISGVDVILIACAINFHSLKENLEVAKIMFVLGTNYSLDVQNSSR